MSCVLFKETIQYVIIIIYVICDNIYYVIYNIYYVIYNIYYVIFLCWSLYPELI